MTVTVPDSLLAGLPDLQGWAENDFTTTIFDRPGVRARPARLALRSRADGSPWFGLSITREADLRPTAAFLDLGLELVAGSGAADLPSVAWQYGWVSLTVPSPTGPDVVAVSTAFPAVPDELTTTVRLATASGLLLRAALQAGGPLPLRAQVTLAVEGVAARAPVTVDLDLTGCLEALAGLPEAGDGIVTRPAVVNTLRGRPDLLGLPPGAPDLSAAVEAITDRLLRRTAPAGPVLWPETEIGYRIERVGRGTRVSWDLSEPVAGTRFITLTLDLVAAVRELLGDHPADELVELRTVPLLDAGRHTVTVHDTLPPAVHGINLLTVRVAAAPRPPARIAPSSASVRLREGEAGPPTPPSGRNARLRLAPGEPLEFSWSTAVVPSAPERSRPALGPVQTSTRADISVQPDDLPVRIAGVSAGPSLLRHGVVRVAATWTGTDGLPLTREVLLDNGSGSCCVAVPRDGTEPVLELTLRSRTGDGEISLGRRRFGSWHADLDEVPAAGPHRILLSCDLPPAITQLAVDLSPVDELSPTASAVVVFTRSRTTTTWSYLPASPFRPGFRYRPHRPADQPAADWSAPIAPAGTVRIPVI